MQSKDDHSEAEVPASIEDDRYVKYELELLTGFSCTPGEEEKVIQELRPRNLRVIRSSVGLKLNDPWPRFNIRPPISRDKAYLLLELCQRRLHQVKAKKILLRPNLVGDALIVPDEEADISCKTEATLTALKELYFTFWTV